jgi:bifunctional non-homologous end joining protein LigD
MGLKKKIAKKPAGKALTRYQTMRDFAVTAEPSGKTTKAASSKRLRYVIQKHAATRLHYDFRLELHGTFRSWAVTRGPSLDPADKRLAVEVEDHPLDYGDFEGTIPKGQYGGGTVMLWDRGTYEAENGGGVNALRDGYARGDLKFELHGERLRGGWVLVRMKRPGRPQWLLIKHRDEFATSAHDVVEDEMTSVVTGRTMDDIAAGKKRASSAPRRKPAAKKRAARRSK